MKGIETYEKLSRPPREYLKEIKGGRLNGKSDINPQWRYKAMTEEFGLCGVGWKYTIDRVWTEPGPNEQVFAWVQISLYIKDGDKWSDAIPGLGGNYLVKMETKELHANDEGFKMAETDALGTAMKKIGVAADVYAGSWDGSKYIERPREEKREPLSAQNPVGVPMKSGLKQRARDIQKALGMPDDVYVAILVAHGAKIVNGKPEVSTCDYNAVVNELLERQRSGQELTEQVSKIFDGVSL